MNPNDIIISPEGTGTTSEEIQIDVNTTVETLHEVYPYLDALTADVLAEVPGAQEAFDALDAKRMQLDDHLYSQLTRLKNL